MITHWQEAVFNAAGFTSGFAAGGANWSLACIVLSADAMLRSGSSVSEHDAVEQDMLVKRIILIEETSGNFTGKSTFSSPSSTLRSDSSPSMNCIRSGVVELSKDRATRADAGCESSLGKLITRIFCKSATACVKTLSAVAELIFITWSREF